MYIGRIVSVAMTPGGELCAGYRVSSRSFPNRTAVVSADKVSIIPKVGHEADIQKNPYIAYNCVRIVFDGEVAIVTNGSHTDPIAEKIALGVPPRDALALPMLALDYEKDQYNTPRIAALVDKRSNEAWLAVVRDDGIEVCGIPLRFGRFYYVATYEENRINDTQSGVFTPSTAQETCDFLLGGGVFAERENAVTAVAAVATDSGFSLFAQDASR